MKSKIEILVNKLGLLPHPEGGFYKETYRSEGLLPAYGGERNYATGIYFLLTSESFSAFHRIKQDEMWHFYDGDPLHLHTISPTGEYKLTVVGRNMEAGEIPQAVVKGGDWFASEVSTTNGYSLVGCTVAPGFDFQDFELAARGALTATYPKHAEVIERLTRV